ncbi:MAG: hypothetical protein RIT81_20690 [Deltaproteobacteria bacterium]
MRLLCLLLALTLLSCGRSEPLRRADRTTTTTTTPTPTTPTTPEPTCRIVRYEPNVRIVTETYFDAPYVSGGRVYHAYGRGQLDGIAVIDVETDISSPLRAERSHRRLVDARDGAVAWTETTSDGLTLFFEHPDVGTEQVASVPFDPRPYGSEFGAERKLIDRTGIVYSSAGLRAWTPGRRPFLIAAPSAAFNAVFGSGHVAFFTEGGASQGRAIEVVDVASGERALTPSGVYVAPPLLTDGALYFTRDRVSRFDLNTQQTEVLGVSAGCRLRDVDAGDFVSTCAPPGQNHGASLEVSIGGERLERDAEGGIITVARIDDGLVAYVHFEDPDALCRGGGTGTVRLWDPDEDSETVVAEVGAPCECCDAISPALGVAFEDGILAWNYALADETPYAIGYATFEPIEVCD